MKIKARMGKFETSNISADVISVREETVLTTERQQKYLG